jgi:membrane dipeptidase
MKKVMGLSLVLLTGLTCLAQVKVEKATQTYKNIHSKAILVDTHNDFLSQAMDYGVALDQNLLGKTHSDLKRWKEGGVDVQFFSVFSDGEQPNPYDFAMRQIDSLDAAVKRNPDKIVKVANTTELYKAVKQHKIAALIGVEGGHQIEDDLNKLDTFYKRGVRYLTLTWNNSTSWATSAADETHNKYLKHKGLTDFGKQIVQHMNALGMMVDISHVGEQTFWDVIATTTKPIIASHSSVYVLCPHQRNLKDDQIKAIAKNGGVIQVNFNSGFLDPTIEKREDAFTKKHRAEEDSIMLTVENRHVASSTIFKKYVTEAQDLRASFDLVIKHIEYIINLVGIDYVGIGSDFDGIELPPQQLDDVTTYPLITKALLEKGYSEKHINKILGGNLLRVLSANEKH